MKKNSTARSLKLVETPARPTAAGVLATDPVEFFAGHLFYDNGQEADIESLWTLITAIEAKAEKSAIEAQDYCQELKRALFTHAYEFDTAMKAYAKTVEGGAK